jgi:membrane-associated protease RseP (regulator of RpoE activity)
MTNTWSWSPFGSENIQTNLDIELLKNEVGKHFPFYDVKYNLDTAAFFCRIDKETLEEKFESLRKSLKEKGLIPMLRYEKGENIIYVMKKKTRKERPVWVNYFLLIATIITTILTGSILVTENFDIWSMPNPMDVIKIENLFNGALLFALPLMSILIVHEMGHYYISKKHGISTSLPFFLPIPPILPSFNIGTFGALISSRDPMPDKKALFDVGIAGPLAGFMVAIPVTAIGIATAEIVPMAGIEAIPSGETIFGSSFLIDIFAAIILDIPEGFVIDMNPILFAGWVGLLITSLNLLPAGQLDGGHIFRAVLGNKQKYAGWVAIFIMILTGWWFFAFVIIFLMGMMHPPPLNDDTQLDLKRKMLFLVAIAILLLCYIPFPIYIAP